MLEVQQARGSVLIPYSPEVVRTVSRERREIVIDPPAGLLE